MLLTLTVRARPPACWLVGSIGLGVPLAVALASHLLARAATGPVGHSDDAIRGCREAERLADR